MTNFKKDLLLFLSNLKKLNVKKRKIVFIIGLTILSSFIDLINPILFGSIINAIGSKSFYLIKINLLIMFVIFFISIFLNYINNMIIMKTTIDIETNMKSKIFSSILNTSYDNYIKIDKGKLLNNLEHDSSVFSNLFSTNIRFIINLLNMIIALILMLFLSPYLTIIFIFTFPITTFLHMTYGNKIKMKEIDYKNNYDSYITFINESMYGWKSLKLFNSENNRNNSFFKLTKDLYKLELDKYIINTNAGIIISISSFFINNISLIIGIILIFKGELSLGMLTAFNSYAEIFKGNSLAITELNSQIQETSVALYRIEDILNSTNHEKLSNNNTSKLNLTIKEIKISNLSYFNSNKTKIFNEIEMSFNKDYIHVIKGESGSGKTTLFNILCKFINKYTGTILVNEINIKDINPEEIRSKISYIIQDNFLYSVSIYENINLYRNIPQNKIIDTCKKLNIHDLIMSLPDQYETTININGTELSGGEKQRICIARAIVGNPEVYLFDEITSAIDKKNTLEIIKIIEEISKNSIVILASHDNLSFSKPYKEYYLENKTIRY